MNAERIRLWAAVVLYGSNASDSPACRYLQTHAQQDAGFLLFDNTDCPESNAAWCRENGFTYLGGEGNLGLSVAYNRCLSYLDGLKAQGRILWLDDDSLPEDGLIDRLLREDAPILAPIVLSGRRILSPSRAFGTRMLRFRSERAALTSRSERLTAINAGLCVRLALYRDYRYDERVFLDGLDHRFLRDMRAKGFHPKVIDARLAQRFSGDETPPQTQALRRYRIFLRDYHILYRERPLFWRRLALRRALRLTLSYRSLAFFQAYRAERRRHD